MTASEGMDCYNIIRVTHDQLTKAARFILSYFNRLNAIFSNNNKIQFLLQMAIKKYCDDIHIFSIFLNSEKNNI